jgi:hypothetical protein
MTSFPQDIIVCRKTLASSVPASFLLDEADRTFPLSARIAMGRNNALRHAYLRAGKPPRLATRSGELFLLLLTRNP